MKKAVVLLIFAGVFALAGCGRKTIEEAETTQEVTPKEEMPDVTVTDSTGKPISQDTSTTNAAGDKPILGKK